MSCPTSEHKFTEHYIKSHIDLCIDWVEIFSHSIYWEDEDLFFFELLDFLFELSNFFFIFLHSFFQTCNLIHEALYFSILLMISLLIKDESINGIQGS